MATVTKAQFLPPTAGDFSHVLKRRVDTFFEHGQISKKANLEMFLKTVFYLGGYCASYLVILLADLPMGANAALAILLGFFIAGIGFNVGHDALHGAYSDSKWINSLLGHSFSLMGASPFNWKISHNVVHHTYTNIAEADGDLHPVRWLRFAKSLPGAGFHRFQHWYALFLYSLTSIVWVFFKDFSHIGRRQHLIYVKPRVSRARYFELIVSKGLYYAAFLAIPIFYTNLSWWQVLLGFTLMHLFAGFSLAITFQLGHLVEGTEFSTLPDKGTLRETWSVHQLKSSSNFSMHSKAASWLLGGLNFQIEHHLFPKICHVHYRHLAPIVQQTAKEFGLPYKSYPSFISAARSHLRYLKATGSPA